MRGTALKVKENRSAAIASDELAIDLNPEDAYSWNNRGIVLVEQGKFATAVAAYDRAIEPDRACASPWSGRGGFSRAREISRRRSGHTTGHSLDPSSVERKQNRGHAGTKRQGSASATPSTTVMPGNEPVPFVIRFSLAIGVVGPGGTRVRRE
ncbi:MAG: tetratricopeptide repeat protein [Methanospirillum sp.]|nr:tetratricopeptide repeat protein [Methanospirillum sp.]